MDAIRELGVSGDVVAVDRLGTPGFLALQALGITLVDSAPATQEAREVKTPEEIGLFEVNGAMVVDMLSAFEAALIPGVRERDLLATLVRHHAPRRGRVPRDEHRVLRPEHEPVAVRGDGSRRRARRRGLRRHRHGRDRGLLLLRVADVPRRRRSSDPRAARHLPGFARLARGRRRPSSGRVSRAARSRNSRRRSPRSTCRSATSA